MSIQLGDFRSSYEPKPKAPMGFIHRTKATGEKYREAIMAALADHPRSTIELATICKTNRTSALIALRALERRGLIRECDRFKPREQSGRAGVIWSLP